MVKKVTTIPATINPYQLTPLNEVKKRKVAGYARVSTDSDEQLTSYEAQVDYYTAYINSREDWEFVEVYTDEGISGTNTKKREGFNRMIADALDGKIDLIITKSVSRFARNTVDSLTTIRKLKENGTEVYFEKESIWTFDSKGELLITIMSSLAQEESRSISENCTWGQRKRFADGKVTVPFKRFLGYDRGEDGNLVVNPDQAKLVKRIYGLFLQGYSPFGIAKLLTEEGILSPGGTKKWNPNNVRSILKNEKYKGDALLQKSYTVDFLTKKKKVNEGEIPQYYVYNNHEAIISEETFDRVQREMAKRGVGRNRISSVSIFSSRLKCGCCGSWYGSKVWHSNSKYKRTIWQCNHKFKEKCHTSNLTEDEIKEVFIEATNQLLYRRKSLLKEHEQLIETILDTSQLEQEKSDLEIEVKVVADKINDCITENARKVQNQEIYQQHYQELVNRYEDVSRRLERVTEKIMDKQTRKDEVRSFMKTLKKAELLTAFDSDMWCSLVDEIEIGTDNKRKIQFKDGTIIEL
ncbi:TPA: recombinase family protein [Streptococcus suis]|nr:recombinase family protein [Streptococcus suis]